MPETEMKSRHPAVNPRTLESHEALVGDILYYISIYPPMKTGSVVVKAERPDGSNWLAIEDEIPQKIKNELERRRQHPPGRNR
ncbi:MAG TPA: hypothetical protein VGN56_00590 [Candidatus Paceibacterota bacterium]|jgi:hypothetical protein|nr:hypothetical protein [Candidatus Paceibacterota bacterium]